MHVIVDTSIFYPDLRLTGRVFGVLRGACDACEATVVVPYVVLEELKAKYWENLSRCERDLRKVEGNLRAAGVTSAGQSAEKGVYLSVSTGIEEAKEGYFNHLLQRLQLIGARIGDIPEIGHVDLVRRAASHQRPFTEAGRGYRDTLIWFSVLATLGKTTEDVVLLSANSKDFGTAHAPGLHPDLVADLEERDIRPARVVLVTTLSDFYQTYVEPAERVLHAWRDRFNQGSLERAKVVEKIADYLDLRGEDLDWSRCVYDERWRLVGVEISDVSVPNLELDDAWGGQDYVGLGGYVRAVGEANLEFRGTGIDEQAGETIRFEVELLLAVHVDAESSKLSDVEVSDVSTPWPIAESPRP